jgi:methionyl-tRNA synthetase
VRNKRLSGQECYFISGDDAHGTPIMIKAQQQGCTPEELVSHIHAQHLDIIRRFHISFDKFSRTDTPANKQRCYDIYERLKKSDLLFEKQHLQAYDKEKQMFLPDRFVKGSCPRCDAADQYGDNCDKCGATYNPQDLKNPYSVLSGTTPEFHSRLHLFTDLKRYQSWLTSYLPSCLSPAVLSKMQEWLRDDLHPWNISRESPYHGIPIPDRPGQYFYVWFDAPIGYLSIFDELFAEKGWGDAVWKRDNLQLVHFIGKDITYFHALFWPVMLKAADLLLPSQIYTHGFLTIEGQKMSKSKGLFVEAQNLAETIPPDLFRYYILSKMNGSIDDFNFDSNELCQKINSDIVGKYLNILSRCSKLLFQYYDGLLMASQSLSVVPKIPPFSLTP